MVMTSALLSFLFQILIIGSQDWEAFPAPAVGLPSDLIQNCFEERECEVACGSGATEFACGENGACLCDQKKGPLRRCRNLKTEEVTCATICNRSVAQACHTDFGPFCSCFVRNGD